MKKIKEILKNIYRRIRYGKKIYVYKKTPILTVNELCHELGINVPKAYQEIKNVPVHKTFLFQNLETKDDICSKIKYSYYKNKEELESLKYKLKRFKDVYEEQKSSLGKTDNARFIKMTVEWLYVFRPIGFYYYDYFDYELYHRTIEESSVFMSRAFWTRVYRASNNKKYTKVLKDKEKFNNLFHEYVNRDFLNTTTCTLEDFKNFVKKNPRYFAKPILGTGGYGAGIIDSKNRDVESLFLEMKKQTMIVEEIVKQHKDLAQFNANTLNTIRVYSLLCADGKVRITMANIRTGRKGKDVDNFHSGGLTAVIDPKTGIVTSDAIDLHHEFVAKHPDTGVIYKGFKVPCWDKLVKAIEKSGKLLPQMRHIGWDVAITSKGEIEFIEGNSMPNFDVAQAPDQVGKKHIYKKYIEELEKKKELKEK